MKKNFFLRFKVIYPLQNINGLFKLNKMCVTDKFKEKETGDEAFFINKKEREVLKKLMDKVKASEDKDHIKKELEAIKAIFSKHRILSYSEELIKDIQKWKEDN